MSYSIDQALNKENKKQDEQKHNLIDLIQIKPKFIKGANGTDHQLPLGPIKYLEDSVGAF